MENPFKSVEQVRMRMGVQSQESSLFHLATRAKPVLKWAGGKSSLLPQMLPFFPKNCVRYFEPFLGGGAVFFSLRPGTPAVLNEINLELVRFYELMRSSPLILMEKLDAFASAYSEDFYYHLRENVPLDAVEQAARTLFLNKTGYNGLYRKNKGGEFNVPFGKRVRCPALYERTNFLTASQHLRSAQLLQKDFADVIDGAQAGDFVYCDPPYEPLSRTSSFNAYTGVKFEQEDQIRLRDACFRAVQRGAQVAISNSSAPFIKHIYAQWQIVPIWSKRAINSNALRRGAIEELLILPPA